jgi:hypothetical protein
LLPHAPLQEIAAAAHDGDVRIKVDAPTRWRQPGHVVSHVKHQSAVGDQFILQSRKKGIENSQAAIEQRMEVSRLRYTFSRRRSF